MVFNLSTIFFMLSKNTLILTKFFLNADMRADFIQLNVILLKKIKTDIPSNDKNRINFIFGVISKIWHLNYYLVTLVLLLFFPHQNFSYGSLLWFFMNHFTYKHFMVSFVCLGLCFSSKFTQNPRISVFLFDLLINNIFRLMCIIILFSFSPFNRTLLNVLKHEKNEKWLILVPYQMWPSDLR